MVPRARLASFAPFLAVLGILLSAPAALEAGQNTWTGNRPAEARSPSAAHIAASATYPDRVFAVFQPDLFRSDDGGRTWTKVASFGEISSLLVHPAEPSTLYVGALPLDDSGATVFKSTDFGRTWSRLTLRNYSVYVQTLVGDPHDAGTVYAGGYDGYVYKTTDEGATWTNSVGFTGPIAALVLDPNSSRNVYSGVDADYYFFHFGAFAKSNDSGTNWASAETSPPFDFVTALAVEPASPQTLFMGVFSANVPPRNALNGLYRSNDSGATWSPSGRGMPGDARVNAVAVDPHTSGTLYAGTNYGVYRSRDSGGSWTTFGAPLGGYVNDLQLVDDGRTLRAGTIAGAFSLELIRGATDIATAASGDNRLLFWDSDHLVVRTMDDGGDWRINIAGESSSTWTATAIASGADGLARVLWQCTDGRWGVETVGASRQSVFVFSPTDRMTAADISVGADGATRILFTDVLGSMQVARMDSSGALTPGVVYGPALGWTAVAIADGADGTHVLWRCADGRGGVSLHDAGGAMTGSSKWAASTAGFVDEDIAAGADGRLRLLRTNTDGHSEISTINASGQPAAAQVFVNASFHGRRISAGTDGRTRLLWNTPDGTAQVWLLNSDNTENSRYDMPALP